MLYYASLSLFLLVSIKHVCTSDCIFHSHVSARKDIISASLTNEHLPMELLYMLANLAYLFELVNEHIP